MQTDIYTFLIKSRSFLLRMRNVSDESCRENQNTHFVFSDFFYENRGVYEIMWNNLVERGRPQMTIRRMRIACWIPKATNTHRMCNTHCLSHHNNDCTKAPQCYVIRTLAVLVLLFLTYFPS
jgi:hypothetical protein